MPDPESPRRLPPDYVEQVRFSWERELERHLLPFQEDRPTSIPEPAPRSFVPLTQSSAARVYRFARDVATVLRCDAPFELFQTRDDHSTNAQALLSRTPFGVRLIGPVVTLLDELALKAMLGHEFGHYLAHGPPANPASTILRPNSVPAGSPVHQACSVARELTADRFGLLACQDLRAAVRLEVAQATGVTTESLGLRELDYLAEVCDAVDAGSVPLVDDTHPSPELRLFSVWLFSRSDVYHRLTGQGSGHMALVEVDARLVRVLSTPQLADALAALARPSTPSPVRAYVGVSTQPDRPPPLVDPAAVDAAARVLAGARSVAARLLARPRPNPLPVAHAEPGEVDLPDDLELRFRDLEARAATQAADAEADLERRFQDLERRTKDHS